MSTFTFRLQVNWAEQQAGLHNTGLINHPCACCCDVVPCTLQQNHLTRYLAFLISRYFATMAANTMNSSSSMASPKWLMIRGSITALMLLLATFLPLLAQSSTTSLSESSRGSQLDSKSLMFSMSKSSSSINAFTSSTDGA